MPEFSVELDEGRITSIQVKRGAPCGATWNAVKKITGLTPEEAIMRIGLESQYYCSADPSAWDPITEKSPVHTAGKIHASALKTALNRTA